MKEKGVVVVYLLCALVIFAAVFGLGIKQTSKNNTPSFQKIIVTEEKPFDVDTEATNSAVEEALQESFEEKVPAPERSAEIKEETFVEKIIPDLEGIQKIKDLVEELIVIQEKETVTAGASEPVVDLTFSPNNDGDLERSGILYYTNLEREKEGLASLKENSFLNEAAKAKTEHMFDGQYFEHVAPTGEDVSYWVDNTEYMYISIGENLARGGYVSEEKMVQDWMNSPGHRANILKESFEEIGIAVGRNYYEGELTWIGVQIFAVPLTACPSINENLLLSIESFHSIIEEIRKTIAPLNSTLSSLPQPTTQKEHDDQVSLVEQYNALVKEERDLNEQLNIIIREYNDQVNAYNACIATK